MSNTAFLRMRIRWETQNRKEIRDAKADLKEMNKDSLLLASSMLELLTVSSLTRSVVKDFTDLASGKGGIQDIISAATSLIIIYFNLIRLQAIAAANQQALLFGLTGGQAAGLAIGVGVLAGLSSAAQTGGVRATTSPVTRTATTQARKLGVQ